MVLAIALDGPICWLQTRGISRGFSVAILALLLLATVGLGGYFGAPILQKQVEATLTQIPTVSANLQARAEKLTGRYPILHDYVKKISKCKQRLTEMGQVALPRLGRFSLDVLSGIVALLLLVAVTFYSVADPAPLVKGGLRALPKPSRPTGIQISPARAGTDTGVGAGHVLADADHRRTIRSGTVGYRCTLPAGIRHTGRTGEAVPVVGPIISCVPPFLVMLSPTRSRRCGLWSCSSLSSSSKATFWCLVLWRRR